MQNQPIWIIPKLSRFKLFSAKIYENVKADEHKTDCYCLYFLCSNPCHMLRFTFTHKLGEQDILCTVSKQTGNKQLNNTSVRSKNIIWITMQQSLHTSNDMQLTLLLPWHEQSYQGQFPEHSSLPHLHPTGCCEDVQSRQGNYAINIRSSCQDQVVSNLRTCAKI